MATKAWVNISSRNGPLPDGTKSLPEPIAVLWRFSESNFKGTIPYNMFENYTSKIIATSPRDH